MCIRDRLHPDLPFQYFLDLVSGLKERFPRVHMKAFTMVEVAYLAKRAKLTIRETLEKMKEAGVESLPGGGAEIFSDRVRHIICDHKIDGDQWLDTARLAHQIGLKSNATMLYGLSLIHIYTSRMRSWSSTTGKSVVLSSLALCMSFCRSEFMVPGIL